MKAVNFVEQGPGELKHCGVTVLAAGPLSPTYPEPLGQLLCGAAQFRRRFVERGARLFDCVVDGDVPIFGLS